MQKKSQQKPLIIWFHILLDQQTNVPFNSFKWYMDGKNENEFIHYGDACG